MAELLHAGCVEVNGVGILITGESGSGKSSLAIELMSRGAMLVADDVTRVGKIGGELTAIPPKPIFGKCEFAGFGILDISEKTLDSTKVKLVLHCAGADEYERLPERQHVSYCGVELPCFTVDASHYALPPKILLLAEAIRMNQEIPIHESLRQAS